MPPADTLAPRDWSLSPPMIAGSPRITPSITMPSMKGVRVVYGSDDCQRLLQPSGWDNLERLFALVSQTRTRHTGRAVARIELEHAFPARIDQLARNGPPLNVGPNISGEFTTDLAETTSSDSRSHVTAFVKLNWGRRRLWPRMTDLRSGQVFQSLPEREWHGIALLQELGLHVQQRMALVRQGRFRFREAILVRKVPPQQSWDEWLRNGYWNSLSEREQNQLLEAVADVLQTIHLAGYGWRGVCTRHLFPEWIDGECRLWLIDCEGVHRRASGRVPERDARKLMKALRYSRADHATIQRMQRILTSRRVV